jgi:hypothetical protein
MSWIAIRASLDAAKTKAEGIAEDFYQQATGYRRAQFTKRCAMGSVKHSDGYLHIGSGWLPGVTAAQGAFVGGHYRTNDFLRCEKAQGNDPHQSIFYEMASHGGELVKVCGLNDLVWSAGDTLTTAQVSASQDGVNWSAKPAFPVQHECGFAISNGTDLFAGFGVSYNASGSPIYDINRAVHKWNGSGWSLVNSDVGFAIRSFGYTYFAGRFYFFAGRDDTSYPTVTDSAVCRSTEDFITFTNHGNLPFSGYGARCANIWGGVACVGSAAGEPNATFSPAVYWSDTPWDVSSFVQLASLPEATIHMALGALTINGVETLGQIGGYVRRNSVYQACGTVHTLSSKTGQWQARTDSDFWVD